MKQSAQQENKTTPQVSTSESKRNSISERIAAIRADAKQGAACDAGFGN